MYLVFVADGQTHKVDMEQSQLGLITVGGQRYRPQLIARRVRKLARRMWGKNMPATALGERLVFDALDDRPAAQRSGDSGSFSPASGAEVSLGAWPEQQTIAIALHEVAHEMHRHDGGYTEADGVVREALALLAEREAGMRRMFEREPYCTAANLVDQLLALPYFAAMPFQRRWAEISTLGAADDLSDLVNYYIDRDYGLGLERWLRRFSPDMELRELLLGELANCSLRFSLDYRAALLRNLVRCAPATAPERLLDSIQAVATLDRRYPQDDLEQIIRFCFAPLARPGFRLSGLLAG